MFAVDTKKPKPQPAGTQQGPVQELETARAVFQNLRDEDRKITAQIQALEGHLNGRAPQSKSQAEDAAELAAVLVAAGAPPPPAPAPSPDSIFRKRRAIQKGLEHQEAAIRALVPRAAEEVYKQYESEHRRLRAEYAKAIIAAKKAHDAERNFAHNTLMQVGALTDVRNRLLLNYAQCGGLPRVLQDMSLEAFKTANKNLLT